MKKSLLFTIVMALLCLFGNVKAQTPGSFECPADAWEWKADGTTNRWDEAGNWTAPKNGAPTVNGVAEQFPGQLTSTDKVYIPNTNATKNGKYPVMDATINVSAIYLESGAMLGNQFHLNAAEWYTDITVPTNRWILVSSPLRGTYSGDFYTTTQGGSYTGPFAPSVYDATSGNEGPNRKFPYVIYERLFSNATQIRYAAYDIDQWDQNWANPTNALAYQFQPGEAVQILARGRGADGETETFHFPASDTEYYYYNSNGQITQKNGADWAETGLSREQSGKPVYNASSMNVTLTRNVPEGQTPSKLWAVGNPAFASLDIVEFLKENLRLGNTARYLYKHDAGDGSVNEANGKDVVYYLNRAGNGLASTAVTTLVQSADFATTEPYINSNRGFKVVQGTGKEATTNYPEDLIGTYTMQLNVHPMNWHIQVYDGVDVGGWIHTGKWTDAQEGSSVGQNIAPRATNVSITISKHPTSADSVIITNFIGMSQPISAYVNTTTNTIQFKAGQVLNQFTGWSRGRDRGYASGLFNMVWTIPAEEFGDNVNMVLMPARNNQQLTFTDSVTVTEKARSNYDQADFRIQTQVANNVDANTRFKFGYTIDNDNVTLTSMSAFAAYPNVSSKTHYFNFYNVGTTTHSTNSGYTDGTFSLVNFFTSAWNCFDSYNGSKPITTGSTVGQASDEITLLFTEKMFTTHTRAASQQSPRRSAAQSDMASISANINNSTINTLITRFDNASNGYDAVEDAAVLGDFDETKISLGTLAGTTVVAVNALNDTTRCQIVLTGVNGDVDLVFDNLAALGENVRLFDANDSTYTPLNGNHATATVTFGVNDSPLRYSLVWDYTPIIAGNETLTAIDFTAFSPAKGEVKVMSNELLKGVRVYNAAGQLITSNNANANEVSFSNLLSGIYVIEAYTANGKATKKVDVK